MKRKRKRDRQREVNSYLNLIMPHFVENEIQMVLKPSIILYA
jgi:hypothetical protein